MNETLTTEVLKHVVIVSNPVPLSEALIILGSFFGFCILVLWLSFRKDGFVNNNCCDCECKNNND